MLKRTRQRNVLISRLRMKPGDILAVKVSGPPLTEQDADRLRYKFRRVLPELVKVVVFGSDISLSVIEMQKTTQQKELYARIARMSPSLQTATGIYCRFCSGGYVDDHLAHFPGCLWLESFEQAGEHQ